MILYFFFFNDTATTEIYTLSLHDALPICHGRPDQAVQRRAGLPAQGEPGERVGRTAAGAGARAAGRGGLPPDRLRRRDRKSTRLNSSHANISYAVFCLKKKKTHEETDPFA